MDYAILLLASFGIHAFNDSPWSCYLGAHLEYMRQEREIRKTLAEIEKDADARLKKTKEDLKRLKKP